MRCAPPTDVRMVRFERILCPTDFSPLSLKAGNFARSIAENYKATLHLLHVVDDAFQYWSALGPHTLPVVPDVQEILAAARQQMDRWKADLCGDSPQAVVTDVRSGQPFLEIIRYARDRSIDLIVLGTHGRSGLSHVLLGSVTERVVRKAPCPVLTVRDPSHKFEMP